MLNQENEFPPPLLFAHLSRFSRGYSTPKILALIVISLAVCGMGSGYLLQLNSRLASAESELRLIRVNEQLLSQELEMERVLKSKSGYDYRDLSRLEVIPLLAVSSTWQMNVNFEVLWDRTLRQGVLILDGNVENAPDYEMEFLAKFTGELESNAVKPIPTSSVPSYPRRRWFEISDNVIPSIIGFELVMRLSEDSKDSVRFVGKLPPR